MAPASSSPLWKQPATSTVTSDMKQLHALFLSDLITTFPSILRFFQVVSPLEIYPNKLPYAFVTLQCLRYKNTNGCEWCRTEHCQVKTAGFVVRRREGVWIKKAPHGILIGQIPSLASIWQTIFLRVICDVIGIPIFTDLCVTMTRP
jgi:hypothetical protein